MEATGTEMENLVSMNATEQPSSPNTAPGGALHSPPHFRRRGLVYGVLGLVVGATIGFVAHPSSGTSDVAEVGGTEASIGRPSLPDLDKEANWPRLAWLMSFPNSGTSYTMRLVRKASLHFTASNYGKGNVDEMSNVSIPVLDGSPNGPFWVDANRVSTRLGNITFPYEGYVLTKTHCDTPCFRCDPSEYVETPYQFLIDCLTGNRVARGPDGRTVMVDGGNYNTTLVRRAVHLLRNPFNNVVSRFRFHFRHHADLAGMYTNDKEGFREFCTKQSADRKKAKKKSTSIEQSILDIVRHVPCHRDFLHYVQWHNLAFTTTRNLQLPTMILHYESYENQFNQTLTELLDFLGYSFQGYTEDFSAGKDYTDYYTEEEREDIYVAIKELSSLDTWKQIQHYFNE